MNGWGDGWMPVLQRPWYEPGGSIARYIYYWFTAETFPC